jgi:site-specific DNA-adenine methylase
MLSFKYSGSKTWLKKRLLAMVDELHPNGTDLVSLFVGSGVLELAYARRWPGRTVTCYDLDANIVNFHLCVKRDDPRLRQETARLSVLYDQDDGFIGLEDYERVTKRMTAFVLGENPDFTMAALLLIVQRASLNGMYNNRLIDKNNPNVGKNVYTRGLNYPPRISFECEDSLEVLAGLASEPRRFVYLDPPYVVKDEHYRHMRLDHARLAELVRSRLLGVHDFAISYNDCEEVRRLYPEADYHLKPIERYMNTNLKKGKPATNKPELLITPAIVL